MSEPMIDLRIAEALADDLAAVIDAVVNDGNFVKAIHEANITLDAFRSATTRYAVRVVPGTHTKFPAWPEEVS